MYTVDKLQHSATNINRPVGWINDDVLDVELPDLKDVFDKMEIEVDK